MKSSALALIALWATASPAWGQTASPITTLEARRHFQEGLKSAQRGDLKKALDEFEAAYAAKPNFSVLYNIGQAHAALGRPVEAVTAFERYLAEGGEQVSALRGDEVNAIIAVNRARIGQLRIAAMANVRIWIDGTEFPAERLEVPVQLAEGPHSILLAEQGCAPHSQSTVVLGGQVVDVQLPRATNCAQPLAQLQIDCEIPNVEVDVIGITKARTPLERPLLAPAGDLAVHFRRAGYAEVSRLVHLGRDKLTRVACGLRVLIPLSSGVSARLIVNRTPPDASVSVDGLPFVGGQLPAGAHQVRVEHDGFQSVQRAVLLEAERTSALSIALAPTAESLRRAQASARRHKRLGLVLGGMGMVLVGTAGGLYVWNDRRYTDWRDRSASLNARNDIEFAASVQRIDDASFAFGLLGAGLTGAGAWLLLVPE